MTTFRRHLDVLCNYHDDFVALGTQCLGNAGGYSGATFWKVFGRKGTFCLRRWASNYPTLERLQFIHAVQWHVRAEGFTKFPMPIETLEGETSVWDDGSFWQLEPWMEGSADFRRHPGTDRLVSAMTALAEFHNASQTFPLAENAGASPTLLEHEKNLLKWTDSHLARIESAVREQVCCEDDGPQSVLFISDLSDSEGPAGVDGWRIGNTVTIPCRTSSRISRQLQSAALRILPLVRTLRRPVLAQVVRTSNLSLPLQPCIHDIHTDHLFFEGRQFRGFIDFGSVGSDNVSVDVARILNALTASSPMRWLLGLAAYQSVRPLSSQELSAIQVFRRSTILTTAIRWLDYIFTQNHPVKCSARLVRRLEKLADTLERL